MSEILHANIFFFITSVAVIIFTLLLCVLVYHAIKALASLRRILDRIEEGAEVVTEDLRNVRAYFTEEGFFPRLLSTLMGKSKVKESRSKKNTD